MAFSQSDFGSHNSSEMGRDVSEIALFMWGRKLLRTSCMYIYNWMHISLYILIHIYICICLSVSLCLSIHIKFHMLGLVLSDCPSIPPVAVLDEDGWNGAETVHTLLAC